MKVIGKLFMAGVFALGGLALMGCEVHEHHDDGYYSKKTTIDREADGDRTVKTEVKRTD